MRRILAILTCLGLVACGAAAAKIPSPSPVSCAELFVRAEASPDAPVRGAYACIDAEKQAELASPGPEYLSVTDDATFAAYAADPRYPTYTRYETCGPPMADGWQYFDLVDDVAGAHEGIRVRLGPNGRVADWNWTSYEFPVSVCKALAAG